MPIAYPIASLACLVAGLLWAFVLVRWVLKLQRRELERTQERYQITIEHNRGHWHLAGSAQPLRPLAQFKLSCRLFYLQMRIWTLFVFLLIAGYSGMGGLVYVLMR